MSWLLFLQNLRATTAVAAPATFTFSPIATSEQDKESAAAATMAFAPIAATATERASTIAPSLVLAPIAAKAAHKSSAPAIAVPLSIIAPKVVEASNAIAPNMPFAIAQPSTLSALAFVNATPAAMSFVIGAATPASQFDPNLFQYQGAEKTKPAPETIETTASAWAGFLRFQIAQPLAVSASSARPAIVAIEPAQPTAFGAAVAEAITAPRMTTLAAPRSVDTSFTIARPKTASETAARATTLVVELPRRRDDSLLGRHEAREIDRDWRLASRRRCA